MLHLIKRVALVAFLGGCAAVGGAAVSLLSRSVVTPALAQAPAAPGSAGPSVDLARTSERFEMVARKVSPAVVAVEARKPAVATKSKAVEESGSGFLVRWPGQRGVLVLTNNHVVAGAQPAQITVSLADDRVLRPSQVLADPESDIAVLRLEGVDNLPTVSLGDSDTVRVGQWVLALGSPFGLNQTVTHGIISARERGQVSLGSTIRVKDFLQTDAAINPGSSGGPLANLEGEVIGINTAIASNTGGSSGVAFSIPINLVKRVLRQLVEKGAVARGYLGMQLSSSFEATEALRMGLERLQGALVETVFPETPAATAGLKVNDVILQVDGTVVRNENHLINLIAGMAPGQRVRMNVWRERRAVALEAVVGDWTQGQSRFRAAQ